MNKIIFRTLATILTFCFISIGAQADSNSEKAKDVSVKSEIEDPDLKLSIVELKKKYPIDWMRNKYGDQNNKFCKDGDSFPSVASWPCGPFCSKNLERKNCPNTCYCYKDGCNKNLPKNLVCTFSEFKSSYDKESKRLIYSDIPLVKFEDFSTNEIKSAFIYYNYYKNLNDSRIQEVVVTTFMYFINTPEYKLNKEDLALKNFVYSRKINTSLSSEADCNFIFYLIDPAKKSPDLKKSFCDHFLNL